MNAGNFAFITASQLKFYKLLNVPTPTFFLIQIKSLHLKSHWITCVHAHTYTKHIVVHSTSTHVFLKL